MENIRKTNLEMHTLLLCADVQFLGITRTVLNQLQVTPKIVGNCAAALALIQEHEFDVIIVDWRELESLGRLPVRGAQIEAEPRMRSGRDHARPAGPAPGLCRRSSLPDSQAGVCRSDRTLPARGLLRHSGATAEAAPRASADLATVSTRTLPFAEAMVVNLSEAGIGLQTDPRADVARVTPSAGEEVDVRFALPGTAKSCTRPGGWSGRRCMLAEFGSPTFLTTNGWRWNSG